MSYSHPATRQDEWVVGLTNPPTMGFPLRNGQLFTGKFVELGAYDGVIHSNTLLLEELGWHGCLIEAHEPFYQQCKRNRPKAAVFHAAIGDGTRQKLLIGGQYTGLAIPMPEDWREEHARRKNSSVVVDTVPLANVIGTDPVDYLSLDTEGGEYEILRDWWEAGGRCEALTVEFRYDGAYLMKLERLALDHGMYLDQIRGFDACFLTR